MTSAFPASLRTREARRSCALRLRPGRNGGFSLLELSVTLFIISVLAALSVPTLKRVQRETRSTAVLNDLRVFSAAFQSYAHDRGDWPAGTGVPAEVPSGMQSYLGTTSWARPTPIGGAYTWAPESLHQGERYRAAVVISSVGENKVTSERQQLTDLDHKLDDGDLETGNFRLGYRNQPVFVIEH